jgi:hypothetical protein
MSLLHPHLNHHVTFTPVDPLGDGLREDILAEQSEPDHIVLEVRPDENELIDYLKALTDDSDSFTFSED